MSGTGALFKTVGREEAGDAAHLLAEFLETDEYYLDSSSGYSTGSHGCREAVDLLIAHPETGAIVIGYEGGAPVSCCVITYAISTSAGSWVTKLDDMYVIPTRRGRGIGTAMMRFVIRLVSSRGHRRIDLSVHVRNHAAKGFYEQLGYRSLQEERLSLLLPGDFG